MMFKIGEIVTGCDEYRELGTILECDTSNLIGHLYKVKWNNQELNEDGDFAYCFDIELSPIWWDEGKI